MTLILAFGLAWCLEAVAEQVHEGGVGGAVGRWGGDPGDVVQGVTEARLDAQSRGRVRRGSRGGTGVTWDWGGLDEDGGVCT